MEWPNSNFKCCDSITINYKFISIPQYVGLLSEYIIYIYIMAQFIQMNLYGYNSNT